MRVAEGGAALFYNYSGRVTRPFIVHASGVHQRLVTAYNGRSWTDIFVPDQVSKYGGYRGLDDFGILHITAMLCPHTQHHRAVYWR